MLHVGAKYAALIINITNLAILARLLSPSEFGAVAIANGYVILFSILGDLGLATSIIHFNKLNNAEIAALFRLSLKSAVCLQVCFCLLGQVVALYVGGQNTTQIFCVASITVLLSTINTVPNAILLRDQQFLKLGVRTTVWTFFGACLGVVTGSLNWGPWALILQSMVQIMGPTVLNIRDAWLCISLTPDRRGYVKVKKYSRNQLYFSIVNYIERNADNLIVGAVFGGTQLALYERAYRLMTYPVSNISGIFSQILHPIMAREAIDGDSIKNKYFDICRVSSIVGVLASVVSFTCADELVSIVLGAQWTEASAIFRNLTLAIWPVTIMATTGPIYQTTGRTDLLLRAGIINASITLAGVVIGVLFKDLRMLALSVAFSNYINLCVTLTFLVRGALNTRIGNLALELTVDLLIMAVIIYSVSCGLFSFNEHAPLLRIGEKAIGSLLIIVVFSLFTKKTRSFKSIYNWS